MHDSAIDSDLSLDFLRVVEQAAIACAHTMGNGDRHASDQVAVEAMRKEMDSMPIDGTIVIGEGERDEAPMLYIGEEVGSGDGPEVDIALDPLEGTTICAKNLPNALAVIAIANETDTRAGGPDLVDEAGVPRPIENDHDQVFDAAPERLRDRTQVETDRRIEIDDVIRSSSRRSARRARGSASSATATCRPASPPPSSAAACTP